MPFALVVAHTSASDGVLPLLVIVVAAVATWSLANAIEHRRMRRQQAAREGTDATALFLRRREIDERARSARSPDVQPSAEPAETPR